MGVFLTPPLFVFRPLATLPKSRLAQAELTGGYHWQGAKVTSGTLMSKVSPEGFIT